ncbi:hypothetical protein KBI52_16140 [Microvirga sp. HBU67558]|uniref:hypothetical protein n=1 Tax=Microvirga TaxID=186650 RepID=UPI001B39674C|nr:MULTISPECIES: hypothetical protein [unclassified Microvirga]MBQ0821722.1 hypothetical protein [Microvirga sp. HBU67558]
MALLAVVRGKREVTGLLRYHSVETSRGRTLEVFVHVQAIRAATIAYWQIR